MAQLRSYGRVTSDVSSDDPPYLFFYMDFLEYRRLGIRSTQFQLQGGETHISQRANLDHDWDGQRIIGNSVILNINYITREHRCFPNRNR